MMTIIIILARARTGREREGEREYQRELIHPPGFISSSGWLGWIEAKAGLLPLSIQYTVGTSPRVPPPFLLRSFAVLACNTHCWQSLFFDERLLDVTICRMRFHTFCHCHERYARRAGGGGTMDWLSITGQP